MRAITALLFTSLIQQGWGAEMFRVSSDPVRAFQGSDALFQWTLSEDLTSRPDFEGLAFGVWENGYLASYILSVAKNGRIVFNTDLNDQTSYLAGRVQWRGDMSKSIAAFEISHIGVQDQMYYALQLEFGAFEKPESDFVRLEVEAETKSAITAVQSPPLSISPGSNASFHCEFHIGEAEDPIYDSVTVGLWERGGIFLTLLTLTKSGTLIINPKLDEEAPRYGGRVHARQWSNMTSNNSVISVEIGDVKESDEKSYGCSMYFGPFKEALGASVRINVQDPREKWQGPAALNTEDPQKTVKVRVDEDVKIACPVLSEVYQLDGTFKAVYWSYCSSKDCSSTDTKWSWMAGMNSEGMTKMADQGPYADRLNMTLNGTLEIYQVRGTDSTDYKCTVKRINYTSPRMYFVTLQVDSSVRPKITIRNPNKVIVQKGNVLYLKCEAEGVPIPFVSWRKNGRVIQMRTNNTNYIRENANEDDTGEYECEASNYAGIDTYRVEVIIQGKDKIWTIIGPVSAVAVLIVAGIVLFIWRKKTSTKNNPPIQQVITV